MFQAFYCHIWFIVSLLGSVARAKFATMLCILRKWLFWSLYLVKRMSWAVLDGSHESVDTLIVS